MYIKLTKKLTLASGSPRRKEILKAAGFIFDVEVKPTDESFPNDIPPNEVPAFLAEKKIAMFQDDKDDSIILCADTVVIMNNRILNKPADHSEAFSMLCELSGKEHTVVTGIALKIGNQVITLSDTAKVKFRKLDMNEIKFYVLHYQPFDKAGAYGIQDFLGMVGIESITGSFYTVMGLPIHLVYQLLKSYIDWSQNEEN